MLSIDLGTIEYYDDNNRELIYKEGGTVRFEYSLKAVYDWESKWRKPFLKGKLTDLSDEEILDFFKTMALDPLDEEFLAGEVLITLSKYISDPNTATTFTTHDEGQNGNNVPSKAKIYTAEELYAIMFSANVPIEFETRNLNRLMTILKIMSNQNQPPKKMSKADILKQNAQLNAERKKKLNTKG